MVPCDRARNLRGEARDRGLQRLSLPTHCIAPRRSLGTQSLPRVTTAPCMSARGRTLDRQRLLDWVSHVPQKTLFEYCLPPHELWRERQCDQLFRVGFFASVTAAESDQVRAFVDTLDPAAPGPYGELSSRVLTVLNSVLEHPECFTTCLARKTRTPNLTSSSSAADKRLAGRCRVRSTSPMSTAREN